MQEITECKKKVLVVDDEPVISHVCKRVLTTMGFDVDVAVDGFMAKGMVDANTYDLCITDIRTPRMNGLEFFQYLEEAYPSLAERVIFTSGDIMSGNVGAFITSSGKPFLPKPFTPGELKVVVGETVG